MNFASVKKDERQNRTCHILKIQLLMDQLLTDAQTQAHDYRFRITAKNEKSITFYDKTRALSSKLDVQNCTNRVFS